MRKFTKRTTAAIAATAIAVGGAGAAYAFWTLSGTGSTETKAGSVVPLVIDKDVVVGELTPGNYGTIKFTAQNRNKFPVELTKVTLSDLSGGTDKCKAADNVEIKAPVTTTLKDKSIPSGATQWQTKSFSVPDALMMKESADNDCQNAVFKVVVTVEARSASSGAVQQLPNNAGKAGTDSAAG
jgi:hypothetical protein